MLKLLERSFSRFFFKYEDKQWVLMVYEDDIGFVKTYHAFDSYEDGLRYLRSIGVTL